MNTTIVAVVILGLILAGAGYLLATHIHTLTNAAKSAETVTTADLEALHTRIDLVEDDITGAHETASTAVDIATTAHSMAAASVAVPVASPSATVTPIKPVS